MCESGAPERGWGYGICLRRPPFCPQQWGHGSLTGRVGSETKALDRNSERRSIRIEPRMRAEGFKEQRQWSELSFEKIAVTKEYTIKWR